MNYYEFFDKLDKLGIPYNFEKEPNKYGGECILTIEFPWGTKILSKATLQRCIDQCLLDLEVIKSQVTELTIPTK